MNNGMSWKDCYDSDQDLIYISGPYNGSTAFDIARNIRNAYDVRDDLITKGWAVICPHANTANTNNDNAYTYFHMQATILSRCDAIYMLRGWEESEGAQMEHQMAKDFGIAVYYQPEGGTP